MSRIVVIESPYKSDNTFDLQRNLAYCRALVRLVVNRGDSPLASHLDITQTLDDRDPEQRERGIVAGLARLRAADVHLFGVDLGWSEGMKRARKAERGCAVEEVSLSEWREAMDAWAYRGDREQLDVLIAANQPRWHAHEPAKRPLVELDRSEVDMVTETQWMRLNDLLTEGAVVELAWLRSAAGLRKDSAVQVMDVLAQSGCCTATTLIFHDCAEHPVSTGLIEWPWKCPDCESVFDSDDAGQVHFERRLTLTKAVRFV